MKNFRRDCLDGKKVVGTFAAIPHPVAAEVICGSGIDFLCLDWEHAQMSRETIEALVRAADVRETPTVVRVPGHAPESVAAALDSGARGVLVPRVSTAAQAFEAVEAARFPPLGKRGVGPGRAAGYGYSIPDYLERANAEVVVAVQIETAEGLAHAAEIAAVDGVDIVFVGPGDLSVSIGALGPDGTERLGRAIEAILAAARAGGKVAGIFCATPADVGRWAAKGATFFILASDTMFLGVGAADGVKAARAALAGPRDELPGPIAGQTFQA